MRLLVFRHGIAEDHSADGTDAARRLTDHGVERTRAAARGLARIAGAPDVVLSSPKVRALETAREAAAVFGREVEVLDDLADGPPDAALAALAARPEASAMIVGHEPMLSELVEQVCTGGRRVGFVDMRKAGCACLEVSFDPAGATTGTLLWLATPKMLRAVGAG
jgi:phosphohistidine phosphatase